MKSNFYTVIQIPQYLPSLTPEQYIENQYRPSADNTILQLWKWKDSGTTFPSPLPLHLWFPRWKDQTSISIQDKGNCVMSSSWAKYGDEILNTGKVLITIIIMRGQLGTRRENTYLHYTKNRCHPGKSL